MLQGACNATPPPTLVGGPRWEAYTWSYMWAYPRAPCRTRLVAGLVLRLMCTTDYQGRKWSEAEALLELDRLVQAQDGETRTLKRFCRTVRSCPAFSGWGPATPLSAAHPGTAPPRPPAPNNWARANQLIGDLLAMVASDLQKEWYGFPSATPGRPPRPADWQPGPRPWGNRFWDKGGCPVRPAPREQLRPLG